MNLPYWTPFAGEGITEFWEYIKVLLFFVAPVVMIAVALYVSEDLIHTIINLFRKKKKEEKNEDDEEIYYY